MKKHFLVVLCFVAIIVSCTKSSVSNNTNTNNNTVTCTGTKSYASDVSPIIQSVCTSSGCHDASSTNGPGPLTNYQQVFNARTTIRSAIVSGLMPKNSSLSASQKSAIICWIDNGASNN
jgi:ribosomal protein S2